MRLGTLFGTAGLSLIAVAILVYSLRFGPACINSPIVKNSGSGALCADSDGHGLRKEWQIRALNTRLLELSNFVLLASGEVPMEPIYLVLEGPRGAHETQRTLIRLPLESALLPGAIEKAFFKAWLLQKAYAGEDQLSLEVISDVLTAIFQGQPKLVDPFVGKRLQWRPGAMSEIGSLKGFCKSRWRQPELEAFCIATTIKPESIFSGTLRAELGARLWQQWLSVPTFERPAILKSWIAKLQRMKSGHTTPVLLTSWKELKASLNQFENLYSLKMRADALLESDLPDLVLQLKRPTKPSDFARVVRLQDRFQNKTILVRDDRGRYWNELGEPMYFRQDDPIAKDVIVEVCTKMSSESAIEKVATKRVMLVDNCEGKDLSYESFLQGGEFQQGQATVRHTVVRTKPLRLLKDWARADGLSLSEAWGKYGSMLPVFESQKGRLSQSVWSGGSL